MVPAVGSISPDEFKRAYSAKPRVASGQGTFRFLLTLNRAGSGNNIGSGGTQA